MSNINKQHYYVKYKQTTHYVKYKQTTHYVKYKQTTLLCQT